MFSSQKIKTKDKDTFFCGYPKHFSIIPEQSRVVVLYIYFLCTVTIEKKDIPSFGLMLVVESSAQHVTPKSPVGLDVQLG